MPAPWPMDIVNEAIASEIGDGGPHAAAMRALAQAAAAQAAAVATGGPVTWTYVATNGSANGQRGNIDAPFATVQQAIDAIVAANSGFRETIWVAPGTYVGNMLTPGGAFPGVTIRGSRGGVLLVGDAGGAPTIFLTPFTSSSVQLELQDLNLFSFAGSRAIEMGSVAAGYAGILRIRNCTIQGQILLTKLNTIGIANSTTDVDIVDIRHCGSTFIYNTQIKNGISIRWNVAGAGSASRSLQSIIGCTISDGGSAFSLQIQDEPFLFIDPSTQIYTNTTAIDGHLGNDPTVGTNVTIEASVTGPANFVFAPAPAATINFLSLTRSQFSGAVAITQSAGGASTRNVVDARGALFKSTLSVPTNTDIDLRSASFSQANLTVAGNATVDRDRWQISGQNIPGGGGTATITLAPPFPAGATYVAMLTPSSAAGIQPSVNTYAPTSFNILPASVAALTVEISLQRL